ncbi:MAG: PIN/TRAM domain-containing protein [Planctomycetota bacterium]
MPARTVQPDILPHDRAEQQRKRLLKIVRAGFLIAFITVTFLTVLAATDDYNLERVSFGPFAVLSSWWLTTVLAVIFGGLAFAADRLTPNKKISTLGAIFFGLVVALLASFALGSVIDLVADLWDIRTADGTPPAIIDTIKVLLGIGIGYICISTVLQTQDDFRLVIPYVEFAKQIRGPRPLLIDSSTLIDARIADVAGVGILQTTLIVPRFVAEELQLLADNQDASVRSRGRRGLEVIATLQDDPKVDVVIDETQLSARGVDRMLVDLAQRSGAIIATTDSGLAAVAEINGVSVLNIHELAKACKPITFEGESFRVRLVRAGEQPGQAVGYLDDGTMVVVNNAEHAIGVEAGVSVESTIPTAAGRMIFAALAEPIDVPTDSGQAAPSENEPESSEPGDSERSEPAAPDETTPAVRAAPTGPNPRATPSQRQRAVSRRNPRR